jgi:flagellar biogenesis protein FliO
MHVVGALIKVALIFALLGVTLKVIGRYGGLQGRTRSVGRPVEVVARSPLARHASLVLVRMGERCYALGVSDTSVNLLTEVDVAVEPQPPSPARTPGEGPSPTWRALIDSLRDRTLRR